MVRIRVGVVVLVEVGVRVEVEDGRSVQVGRGVSVLVLVVDGVGLIMAVGVADPTMLVGLSLGAGCVK